MSIDQEPQSPDFGASLIDTTVYVEPEVPDPFLIDEEGDETSDQEKQQEDDHEMETASIGSSIPLAAQEIALLSPSETAAEVVSVATSDPPPPVISPLNVDKDVPLPPVEDYMTEEEEVPDLFLPGLINSTMFLPIPNVRPRFFSLILSTCFTKF
jgi:hypothetical protein